MDKHIIVHRQNIAKSIYGSYNQLEKAEKDDHETPGFQQQEDQGDVTDFDEDNSKEDQKEKDEIMKKKAMGTGNTPGKETVEKSISYTPDGSFLHKNISQNILKSYSNAEDLIKGGPGSGRKKSGPSKIIGKTKSGKDIHEYIDDSTHFKKEHKDWKPEDHQEAVHELGKLADASFDKYNEGGQKDMKAAEEGRYYRNQQNTHIAAGNWKRKGKK